MIDTLRYTKELKEAGLNQEQAELMVKNHFLMIADHVATKAELKELEYSINLEIKNLSSKIDRIDSKFAGVDFKFLGIDSKFDGLENKLIVKLGAITVASVTAMTGFLSALMIFIQK